MPFSTVCRGRAPLASGEVTRQGSSSSRRVWSEPVTPLVKCPMTCRKGFVVGLAHVRLLPAPMARPLVASGRSRACGKTCRSALSITSHRQTRIWQPTFLRGRPRSLCSRCLTCGPAISAGSAQRNTAVRKEDLRSKPTRRVSPPPGRPLLLSRRTAVLSS